MRSLAYSARGNEVREPAAFLRTVVSRAALKRLSRGSVANSSPTRAKDVFDLVAVEGDPERALQARLETAWLAEALDGLSGGSAPVYGARFVDELDARDRLEAARLSLRPTYFRRLQAATSKVEAVMGAEERIGAEQRALVRTHVLGIGSKRVARRARRLIQSDPAVAAEARELRSLHRGAALLLPPLALVPHGGGVLSAITAAAGWLRDELPGVRQRRDRRSTIGGRGSKLAAGLAAAALCVGGGLVAFDRDEAGGADVRRGAQIRKADPPPRPPGDEALPARASYGAPSERAEADERASRGTSGSRRKPRRPAQVCGASEPGD